MIFVLTSACYVNLFYLQDYVCLDYELPAACSDLLDNVTQDEDANDENIDHATLTTLHESESHDVSGTSIKQQSLPPQVTDHQATREDNSTASSASLTKKKQLADFQLPRILLAGVQKSASTAVADFLHRAGVCLSRPDPIHKTEQKSVYFFDKNYDQGIKYYSDKFAHCKDMSVATDATPNNFRWPRRIRKTYDSVSPDQVEQLKVVVVVRDPVARELSWYNHIAAECTENPDRCNEKVIHRKNKNGTSPLLLSFPEYAEKIFGGFMENSNAPISRSASFYGHYLQEWYHYFDPKQILVLSYSELVSKESTFLRRIVSFLDLEVDLSMMKSGTARKNTHNTPSKVVAAPCDTQVRLSNAFKESNKQFFNLLDQVEGPPMQQAPFPQFELQGCFEATQEEPRVNQEIFPQTQPFLRGKKDLSQEAISLPSDGKLVLNSGFEDGTISSWKKSHAEANVAVVAASSPRHGSFVVSITNRTEEWHGIGQDIGSRLTVGVRYKVSAFVQLDSAPHNVRITFREGQEGPYKYITGANGTVATANEWVEIQGHYIASEDRDIKLYFDAPKNVNLLIDAVSVVEADCDLNTFVHQFSSEELDLTCNNWDELEVGKEVGRGYSRKVSEATWRGSTVAVKEDVHSASGSAREALREASLLFQLTESRNILRLVGLCNSTMVFEYAPTPLKKFVMDRKNDISVEKALSLGLDVVNSVAQLHSMGPVVHGDLHIGQYLINSEGKVQLGDLELSRYVGFDNSGKKCTFSKVKGDLSKKNNGIFDSPERLSLNDNLDEKTDIYRVALTLWSLLSRESPYKKQKDFKHSVIAGERPSLDLVSGYPQEMKDLIVEAWDSDPQKRPSATEMAKRMRVIVKQFQYAGQPSKTSVN